MLHELSVLGWLGGKSSIGRSLMRFGVRDGVVVASVEVVGYTERGYRCVSIQ